MRTGSLASLALLALGGVLPEAGWAEDLPCDPRIATGKLNNGVTWIYRQHANPRDGMALVMHVAAGSLCESDSERGLARFVTHLAFRGTQSFTADQMAAYFKSLGMEFGGDQSAEAGFHDSKYVLFVPGTEVAQVDQALRLLSDQAFRCRFSDEEIERARGGILEKQRSRTNAFRWMRDETWPELFVGSRVAERMPTGSEQVIRSATREQLVEFYSRWYRPERITLLMVGAEKPDAYVSLIEKWFGDYQPTTPPPKSRGAEFKPFTEPRAVVVSGRQLPFPACQVAMYDLRPGRPPATTVAQVRAELVEELGSRMLFRRAHVLEHDPTTSFHGAVTGVDDSFNEAALVTCVAHGEPEKWPQVLEELIVEIQRARKHGFAQRELDEVARDLKLTMRQKAETEASDDAAVILQEMVAALSAGEPMMSPTQEAALIERLLPTISVVEVSATFAETFKPGTFTYVVTIPEKEGVKVPARADVLAVARAALAREVAPPTSAPASP